MLEILDHRFEYFKIKVEQKSIFFLHTEWLHLLLSIEMSCGGLSYEAYM